MHLKDASCRRMCFVVISRTDVIAFAGTLQLARGFVSRLAATVAALLFTFWGLHWYNNIGQLNVALASALLPWMLWSLERGFASPRRAAGWRSQRWRPVLFLACVGVILALGLTLKWNDLPVKISLLRLVNELIWRADYRVNPEFYFAKPPIPPGLAEVVPLPALALATFVPFFAQARVLARYALLSGLAVFLNRRLWAVRAVSFLATWPI